MNRDDIRVIKTVKSIQQAFFDLMAEKNYQEITVQHILDKAQINRTTFYKHYMNKDALAKQLVEEVKENIAFPMLNRRFEEPTLTFIQKVAPLLTKNKEKIRLLWKIETPKIHLKQDMYYLVKQKYIEAMTQKVEQNEAMDLEFQGHMYASFAIASISFNLENKKEINPLNVLANMKMVYERAIL